MLVRLALQELAAAAQVLEDLRIGFLDAQPSVGGDALVVGAVGEDGVDRRQIVGLTEAEVVLAEGDGCVHEAGAVLGGDEVGGQHRVALLAVLGCRDEVERRLIGESDELGAGECLRDPHVRSEQLFGQRLGDDEVVVCADVGELRVDGDGGIGHERPRRRRPDHELAARARKDHVGRWVDHVLVDAGLAEFVARERRAATRAVRDHLQSLEQEVLLVDRLQRPPDRLDVARVERPVRVLGVHPVADAVGQPRPVIDVAEHDLTAAGVEAVDPVALDVGLLLHPQLALDGEFDRQAVAVPAALTVDLVPAHRPVAGEDVLEYTCQHVV